VNGELERMWKNVLVTFKVVSEHLAGGTGENHEKYQSG